MNPSSNARVDDRLRSEIAEALTQRHETLARQHDQLTAELEDAADDADIGVDAAQLLRATLEQVAGALEDTDRALARVRHDDFGSCELCPATIAAERLRALPDTTRCTACASVP